MGASEPVIASPQSNRVRLVVASSVMLTFISFWRAAAIVLNDLGSSAFYAGGLSEEAVGKSAPWLILGVVVFSYAVRAVYVESCSMFTRGGVYRIVKEALGGTFAKVSVSALMFDYVLTGLPGFTGQSCRIFARISVPRSLRSASRCISGGKTSRALKSPVKKR
jgi:hypothetical protein